MATPGRAQMLVLNTLSFEQYVELAESRLKLPPAFADRDYATAWNARVDGTACSTRPRPAARTMLSRLLPRSASALMTRPSARRCGGPTTRPGETGIPLAADGNSLAHAALRWRGGGRDLRALWYVLLPAVCATSAERPWLEAVDIYRAGQEQSEDAKAAMLQARRAGQQSQNPFPAALGRRAAQASASREGPVRARALPARRRRQGPGAPRARQPKRGPRTGRRPQLRDGLRRVRQVLAGGDGLRSVATAPRLAGAWAHARCDAPSLAAAQSTSTTSAWR